MFHFMKGFSLLRRAGESSTDIRISDNHIFT